MNENELVKTHKGLVLSIALSFQPNKISDYGDLIQAGYVGLLQASRNFKPDKEIKFSTFATRCITNSIIREFQKHKLDENDAISVSTQTRTDNRNFLWEYFPSSLTDEEIEILNLRMESYTYYEIGEKMGFSHTTARYKFKEIVKKLKEVDDENT